MAAYISFQPTDYYKTQLYTGTGAENAQTFPQTAAMQPDFTWIKARTGSKSHRLFDSPRGVTNWIASDNNGAESTTAESLKSFDSDGFTLGTYDHVNDNTVTFASWNWKGGTTSGITTNGSTTITPSSYSFSAAAGISIVKYTGNYTSGAKVAHGLGAVPELIIVKRLDAAAAWAVYMKAMGNTKNMKLNTNANATTSTAYWNDTTPDSVNFTLGNNTDVNNSGTAHVAYCFAPIKGFSRFGNYSGNGDNDGPMIFTGFRPAFLMTKSITDAGDNDWHMMDDKRNGFNPENWLIQADLAIAEETGSSYEWVDFVSNGFKMRTNNGSINSSGANYSYMAFGEFPFVSSNSIPTTAR